MDKISSVLLASVLIATALLSGSVLGQVNAQEESEPQPIIIERAAEDTGPSIPWEAVASAIIAFLVAITAYLNNQKQKKGEQVVELAKDKEFQQQAVIDLAAFAFKAYQANADGKIDQDEFNMLMEEGKALASKYGDKFGVKEEIDQIISEFTPKNPQPPP